MAYQSFRGSPKGASNSAEKLDALHLPDDMTGKAFLDIGCNEGFFCIEAKRRGARTVVGLDKSVEVIEAAKKRAADAGMSIQYVADDWMNLPVGKFDIILFASSLHYANKPIALFDLIYDRLNDDGLLVLECGYGSEMIDTTIIRAIRKGGPRYYPRYDILWNEWLRKFAVRRVAKSVDQSGDPIPRAVFHCRKWATTVIFILGEGHAGKTTIANKIASDVVIRTDVLLNSRVADNAEIPDIEKRYRKLKESSAAGKPGCGIATAWKLMSRDPKAIKYFADLVRGAIEINKGTPVIAVEGYILADLLPTLRKDLHARGYRTWVMKQ